MPESKKEKSRKQKLLNYKKSKKMNKKTPEMRPFVQVPTWDANESFEIKGSELEALYNFFNIFAPSFTAVQSVFARGVQEGKVQIGYQYEDGTPVPDADVKAYTEKLNQYFQQKMAEQDQPKSSIVDVNGAPIDSTPITTDDIAEVDSDKEESVSGE